MTVSESKKTRNIRHDPVILTSEELEEVASAEIEAVIVSFRHRINPRKLARIVINSICTIFNIHITNIRGFIKDVLAGDLEVKKTNPLKITREEKEISTMLVIKEIFHSVVNEGFFSRSKVLQNINSMYERKETSKIRILRLCARCLRAGNLESLSDDEIAELNEVLKSFPPQFTEDGIISYSKIQRSAPSEIAAQDTPERKELRRRQYRKRAKSLVLE